MLLMADISTTLKSNYPPILNKLKKKESSDTQLHSRQSASASLEVAWSFLCFKSYPDLHQKKSFVEDQQRMQETGVQFLGGEDLLEKG